MYQLFVLRGDVPFRRNRSEKEFFGKNNFIIADVQQVDCHGIGRFVEEKGCSR
jgi:hypothetical protein